MSQPNKQTNKTQQSGKKTKRKGFIWRLFRFGIILGIFGSILGAIAVSGLYLYMSPNLPEVDSLKDVHFQVPLRVYTADGKLMGEFGEKRRLPLTYPEIPENLVQAVLGAEDDRFFEHPGVDYHGILRAIAVFATTGQKAQGGSTITMQVARNFFLSSEKTFLRKFSEIFLSFRIEQQLSKEEILSLYMNKIYLGNRAYGVGAAAQIYYGKSINELDLAQLAMIAGLPKAPSRYNPIVNPTRAKQRRNYVLRRMLDLKFIDVATYGNMVDRPVTAKVQEKPIELEAPYAAEMVRQEMLERFGENAYTDGYEVYTTLQSQLQDKANSALRNGLLAYEERHGYRGPIKQLNMLEQADPQQWQAMLDNIAKYPLLHNGVVLALEENAAYVYLESGQIAYVPWLGLKWAAPYINGNRTGRAPVRATDVLAVGDVIRLHQEREGRWTLGQMPEVSGALVSLNVKNGAIQSIVGGYDFYHSKFNRALQAKRQPGSNFKPFVYSAALEKGYTAATLINDAPVVFNDAGLEESWRPENYSGKFYGPTRLREALVKSRNLVSIRILRSIGIKYAISYAERFGFIREELPRNLSLALGSATVTPLELVQGYAVFANGGYLVKSYLVDTIIGPNSEVLFRANPATVCSKCEQGKSTEQALQNDNTESTDAVLNLATRVVDEKNVYIMTSMMRDIIQRGTGRRAKVLKRADLAGKTGTTNDQRDAWFSGFNAEIATTVWVGFDAPHPLGDRESGARAALPVWIDYMREALKSSPETPLVQPQGIVTVRIDPGTGLLANTGFPKAIFESFRETNVPSQMAEDKRPVATTVMEGETEEAEQLF